MNRGRGRGSGPTQFMWDTVMTPTQILYAATTIWEADIPCQRKETYFHDTFAELRTQLPGLYRMACELDFDISKLRAMLGLLGEVNSNTISQHDASVRIGEQLYTQFVTPIVGAAAPHGVP